MINILTQFSLQGARLKDPAKAADPGHWEAFSNRKQPHSENAWNPGNPRIMFESTSEPRQETVEGLPLPHRPSVVFILFGH